MWQICKINKKSGRGQILLNKSKIESCSVAHKSQISVLIIWKCFYLNYVLDEHKIVSWQFAEMVLLSLHSVLNGWLGGVLSAGSQTLLRKPKQGREWFLLHYHRILFSALKTAVYTVHSWSWLGIRLEVHTAFKRPASTLHPSPLLSIHPNMDGHAFKVFFSQLFKRLEERLWKICC